MMTLDCTTMFLSTLCRELNLAPSALAQCIVCLEDGVPIAGGVCEGFNTYTITAHIWIKEGKKPSKEWFAAIFDYPFNQLGVNKILGHVLSKNEKAIRLDEKFGYTLEAVIKDYSPDGDLLIYSMTRDKCRVLNSPAWASTIAKLQEAS